MAKSMAKLVPAAEGRSVLCFALICIVSAGNIAVKQRLCSKTPRWTERCAMGKECNYFFGLGEIFSVCDVVGATFFYFL